MARRLTTTALLPALALAFTVTAGAQTRIELQKNKYTPAEDVKLGQEAAVQVRREYPMLNDATSERLVDRIGNRLKANIPQEFRQPAFRYSFDVVNMREINAFALPGGPMFVNRGMIEASGTEAEVAGVMAHELAHVVLRHGTVQASKAQKFQIGAIAGQILGAIVGGNAGSVIAQGSEFGLGAYFLKYGREFEREADLLGAQIMARSGYDARAMATMFERIEKEGGRGGPEWLSSHPNPGNRSAAIRKEAEMLAAPTYAGNATEFRNVKTRLGGMAAAPTAEQVARAQKQGQRIPSQGEPVGTSGRGVTVAAPSNQWRTFQPNNALRVTVPANWNQIGGESGVMYVPEGGYFEGQNGSTAFTHGVQVGVVNAGQQSLQAATDALVQSFAQSNPDLRRTGNYARVNVGGRNGLGATLTNMSAVTGQQEYIQLSTTTLSDGSTLFMIGVAPQSQARSYQSVFNRVRQGIVINDR
ncbi:MAG: M48 family metalloprotease [Acidobacteria bacterium]|nr:M48 family metalloprotease [Acidobacteriota bacterium]